MIFFFEGRICRQKVSHSSRVHAYTTFALLPIQVFTHQMKVQCIIRVRPCYFVSSVLQVGISFANISHASAIRAETVTILMNEQIILSFEKEKS